MDYHVIDIKRSFVAPSIPELLRLVADFLEEYREDAKGLRFIDRPSAAPESRWEAELVSTPALQVT